MLISGCAGTAIDVSSGMCAQPRFASERLICLERKLKSETVQYSVGGALLGAALGAVVADMNGEDKRNGALIGAAAGGLAGYWLNVQRQIQANNASKSAQATELALLSAEREKQMNAELLALRAELATVRRLKDADEKRIRLLQIQMAAQNGASYSQESRDGAAAVGEGLGIDPPDQSGFNSLIVGFNEVTRGASGITRV